MTILVSSAHYHLSDKYGSEAQWGVDLLNSWAALGHQVHAVAGVAEMAGRLHPNVRLTHFASSRSTNPLVEIARKLYYPLYAWFNSWRIFSKLRGRVDLVVHIAPVSPVSFDLFFLLHPRTRAVFMLGPAQPPASEDTPQALGRVLGTGSSFAVRGLYLLLHLAFPLLHALFRATLARAQGVIVPTSLAKNYYRQFISPAQIYIIPVGTKPPSPARSFRRIPGRPLNLLYVGYLTSRKGVDILLQACRQLVSRHAFTDFHLTVVGSGEELPSLQELTRTLDLNSYVDFVGFVDHARISVYYRRADVFCSPTRFEPYGMTVIEALSFGLPAVVSRVNSLPELVGAAALLAVPDDPDDLAAQLHRLLTHAALRSSLARKAAARFTKLFTWDKISRDWLAVYERISPRHQV